MTNRDLLIALRGIDERFVLEAAPAKSVKKRTMNRKQRRTAYTAAVAAALLLATVALPILRVILPAVPGVASDGSISGKQYLYHEGGGKDNSYAASPMPTGFTIDTIIEAAVEEVLPDSYYMPGDGDVYHVVKLRVLDQIRAENMPEEIYFRYAYYGTDIFDGYDSLILSLKQIGVENYMMINTAKGRADYFSDMFETYIDVGYGSVIAFRDGTVDPGLWDRANRFETYMEYQLSERDYEGYVYPSSPYDYPAKYGCSVEKVKENIRLVTELTKEEYEQDTEFHVGQKYDTEYPFRYVTADDVFTSEDARRVREYMTPAENNVFMHKIWPGGGRVIGDFTRVVNGFATDERFVINGFNEEDGVVQTNDVYYSSKDFARMPDIGKAIARLDPSKLKPRSLRVNGMDLIYCRVKGFYRKVDGKVYGIVVIVWHYSEGCSVYEDYRYELYGSSGIGRIVSRSTLHRLIGDDTEILGYDHGWGANHY